MEQPESAAEIDLCEMYQCEHPGELAYPTHIDLLRNLILLETAIPETTVLHAVRHGLLTRCREAVAQLIEAEIAAEQPVKDSVNAALAELREMFPKTSEALLEVVKQETFGQLARVHWVVRVWDLRCSAATLAEAMLRVRGWGISGAEQPASVLSAGQDGPEV